MGDFDINSFLNDVAAKSGQGPVAPVPAVITAPVAAALHDGPAINPPESSIETHPALVALAAAPVEKAKRGRKQKGLTDQQIGPITHAPIEPPTTRASMPSDSSADSYLLGSILQGLCSNPALSCMPAGDLADRAIAIADEVA